MGLKNRTEFGAERKHFPPTCVQRRVCDFWGGITALDASIHIPLQSCFPAAIMCSIRALVFLLAWEARYAFDISIFMFTCFF
jgi:hypothetical protein